ncbi:Remorin, N-terminal region [Musa troglodytarum]|uniref:Remorin, N-terminal region n=1 Tax=Musa troglodytarum TaxID=320322 RepID=A0A9E7ETN9_9LILI|nr:Remorin, N-terminal region [Musa troglodytarum]
MGERHSTLSKMENLREAADENEVLSPPVLKRPKESKALMGNSSSEKGMGGSADRDALLAQVENDKRISLIRAWSEGERTKADNKAQRKMSSILSWENTKMATIEAEIKKNEERLEMKKADFEEKAKNKIAMIHKEAEERRAMVDSKHGEELLRAEEAVAKYHSAGHTPKKGVGCFSSFNP